jgi:hypothetical protein
LIADEDNINNLRFSYIARLAVAQWQHFVSIQVQVCAHTNASL